MRKKRTIAAALSLLLILALLCSLPGAAWAEKAYGEPKRFNVVLVVDKSGSLCCEHGTGTDPDGLRFDALRLFLALLTESGNNVGAVVFDEHIRFEAPIEPITGMEEKKALIRELEEFYPSYDTDIGSAMLRAVDMLRGMKLENDLPCMILLFSDGKTDFSTGDILSRLHASWANADKALNAARAEGITINGILLNVGGVADRGVEEFRLYSYGTGGQFEEVKDAPDLAPAFRRLYQIVTSAAYTGNQRVSFSDKGEAELFFTVPSFGVEEVNVIVEGENLRPDENEKDKDKEAERISVEILRPNGESYDVGGHSLENIRYMFYKIPEPDLGVWHVLLKGQPRDWVDVTMVGNPTLSVTLESEIGEGFRAHTPYSFMAGAFDSAVPTLSEDQLNSLNAVLVREDLATGAVSEFPFTERVDNYFYFDNISFPSGGQFNVSAVLSLGDFRVSSALLPVSVETAPLVPLVSSVSDMTQFGQFRDGVWELELAEMFGADRESGLHYELSNDCGGVVKIENGVLKVRLQDANPLSFNVKATDLADQSASIAFDVTAPSVTSDINHVTSILSLGQYHDSQWDLDLNEIFYDPKGGELSYALSSDCGGAVSLTDGILTAQLEEGAAPLSFNVTATDITQQSSKVAFSLVVPTISAKLDRVTNILKLGQLHDFQWDLPLNGLFYDESGSPLSFTLSDDCGGALTIEDGVLHADLHELREAQFEVTAANALDRHASVPFSIKVPGPSASVGPISETVKTGLFQEGIWERPLNSLFSEPKGTAMSYTLSDDFGGAVKIENGTLHVNVKGLKKAAFTITATDEYGISTELPITITEKNMTPIYILIALGTLLGVGGIVFGIIYWRRYYW